MSEKFNINQVKRSFALFQYRLFFLRHLCVCERCWSQLERADINRTCPLCRKPVQEVIKEMNNFNNHKYY